MFRHAELVSASLNNTLKQVQGDVFDKLILEIAKIHSL